MQAVGQVHEGGQATDELFAMAEGKPGQRVMKMTQVIWYRSRTAPELPKDEAQLAQWEKDQPDAEFITIAPDHLREAFWSKLSRPIRGIMYHGWQSLVDTGSTKGYVFTHPETQNVLTELTRDVVRPLGPTLLQVPDREADVAILESFASQVFAGRGTPLAAVVPVHVDVLDPNGRPAEFSGHYGAKNGRLSLRLDLAANDAPGAWTIRARELASDLTREATLTVTP